MQELESNRRNHNKEFEKQSNAKSESSRERREVFSTLDFDKFMTLLRKNRQVNAMSQ